MTFDVVSLYFEHHVNYATVGKEAPENEWVYYSQRETLYALSCPLPTKKLGCVRRCLLKPNCSNADSNRVHLTVLQKIMFIVLASISCSKR
jgi:hypothetical protein